MIPSMRLKIVVRCHTELVGYKFINWPTEMCVRPEMGDRVSSTCGQHILRVWDIVHMVDMRGNAYLAINLVRDIESDI